MDGQCQVRRIVAVGGGLESLRLGSFQLLGFRLGVGDLVGGAGAGGEVVGLTGGGRGDVEDATLLRGLRCPVPGVVPVGSDLVGGGADDGDALFPHVLGGRVGRLLAEVGHPVGSVGDGLLREHDGAFADGVNEGVAISGETVRFWVLPYGCDCDPRGGVEHRIVGRVRVSSAGGAEFFGVGELLGKVGDGPGACEIVAQGFGGGAFGVVAIEDSHERRLGFGLFLVNCERLVLGDLYGEVKVVGLSATGSGDIGAFPAGQFRVDE